MAIVLAVLKWRHYLLGRHFVIWTNQQSLRFITAQHEIGAKYQRWVSNLLGYDFEIKFRPGATNQAADAFLQHPSLSFFFLSSMVSSTTVDWGDLHNQLASDPFLASIIAKCTSGETPPPGYTFAQGRLWYKVPPNSPFIAKLLHEYHNSAIGGHNGEFKTYLLLTEQWFWVGMRKQVTQFVRDCLVC